MNAALELFNTEGESEILLAFMNVESKMTETSTLVVPAFMFAFCQCERPSMSSAQFFDVLLILLQTFLYGCRVRVRFLSVCTIPR